MDVECGALLQMPYVTHHLSQHLLWCSVNVWSSVHTDWRTVAGICSSLNSRPEEGLDTDKSGNLGSQFGAAVCEGSVMMDDAEMLNTTFPCLLLL
jgi:hypothetical protein